MSGVENDIIPFGSALGNRAELGGLNIVGLKRRGFSARGDPYAAPRLPHAVRPRRHAEGAARRRGGRVLRRAGSDEDRRLHPRRRRPRALHAAAKRRRIADGGAAAAGTPIAIIAGGGALPRLVRDAALRSGRRPVRHRHRRRGRRRHLVGGGGARFCIGGEIGRLFRILRQERLPGGRPDRLGRGNGRTTGGSGADLGTVRLLPEHPLASCGRATIICCRSLPDFWRNAASMSGPLEIAPELAMPEGGSRHASPMPARGGTSRSRAAAARDIGRAAISGRAPSRSAAGSSAPKARKAPTPCWSGSRPARARARLRSAGGVLVKCMKPQQDPRLDMPTHRSRDGRLRDGTPGSTVSPRKPGATLLAGREETIAAFARAGLFLFGLPSPGSVAWSTDRPLTIAIVVGEESGDQLGAGADRCDPPPTAGCGVHGRRRRADEGARHDEALFPLGDVAVMGFGDRRSAHLPRIVRRVYQTVAAILRLSRTCW